MGRYQYRGIFVALFSFFLISCGGGGSSSSKTVTVPSGAGNNMVVDNHDPFGGGFNTLQLNANNNVSVLSCTSIDTMPLGSTLTGKVLYQRVPLSSRGLNYNNQLNAPARGVVVEAVAELNNVCGDDVVDSTITDGEGNYGLIVPANQAVCVQVRAQMFRDGRNGGPAWNVQVSDNTQANAAYYLLDNTPATPADDPVRHLLASSGWSDSLSQYTQTRSAAPFAILDSACHALDAVITADANINLPTLYFRWSPNNNIADGAISEGDVGGAYYTLTRKVTSLGFIVDSSNEIFLLGDDGIDTDEYDPHVITHEYGHYLIVNTSRSDSLGGSHSLGDKLDMTVAFDEGAGDAFSGIVLDIAPTAHVPTPGIYQDNFGPQQANAFRFNLASGGSGVKGWFNEASVYRIMYNLFDPANGSGNDQISLPFSTLYNSLVNVKDDDSLISIYSYINRLKADNAGSATEIDTLVNSESVIVNDSFGLGQHLPSALNATNDDDILPVYLEIPLGTTQQVCSNTQFGVHNKLSVVRYLTFIVPGFGRYAVNLRPIEQGKPAIEFYKAGQLIDRRTLDSPNTLNFNLTLSSGIHVIAIYDIDNLDEDGEVNIRHCFELTIG